MATDVQKKKLDGLQKIAFKDCESKIERGLKTFYEVGSSLMEIRDQRYYRESHETFEEYCQERWGFTRVRAHQLIQAAKTTDRVNNCSHEPPRNEAQARELSKLPDEDQGKAWQETVKRCGGADKVTAAAVREVVDEMAAEEEVGIEPDESEEEEAEVPPEVVEAVEDAREPSFCNDLRELIDEHRKIHKQPWCVIVSVLRNTLDWAEQQRD